MPWRDVPCRETVRRMIVRSARKNMLAGSHLIYGPPGAGQVQVGRALAKTLLCGAAEFDFCGECGVCRRVEALAHPDCIELRPENDWSDPDRKGRMYSVEHMRRVMEFAREHPYEADRKVFIVHDAHRITIGGANSQLKMLEEPPAHVMFILLSDNDNAILPTIKSRCRKIRLSQLDTAGLAGRLEGASSKQEAETLARAAGGLPEKAHQLLESGYLSQRDEILAALKRSLQSEYAVGEAADLMASAKDEAYERLIVLIGLLRDASLLAAGVNDGPFYNPDQVGALTKIARGAPLENWFEAIEAAFEMLEGLDRNYNSVLMFTSIFLRLREKTGSGV